MITAKITTKQYSELADLAAESGKGELHTRFLIDGQAVDPVNGKICSKGCNVVYQPLVWDLTPELQAKFVEYLKMNNPTSKVTYYA